MDDQQDDIYAARRAELDQMFRDLPPAGAADYWSRIDGKSPQGSLPNEALARCLRERFATGATGDAERIFAVLMRQIQSPMGRWAGKVASQVRSGMKGQMREDLEQECYMKLWAELADGGPTFLLENFLHRLGRIQQHVAHDLMERAGEWRRPGVETPTRVPRGEIDSLQAEPQGDDAIPLATQMADPDAQTAYEQAELSDLLALVENLPEDDRAIILDRFWRDRSQKETATALGLTDRMIRYRLAAILRELGVRYRGGEEASRG